MVFARANSVPEKIQGGGGGPLPWSGYGFHVPRANLSALEDGPRTNGRRRRKGEGLLSREGTEQVVDVHDEPRVGGGHEGCLWSASRIFPNSVSPPA